MNQQDALAEAVLHTKPLFTRYLVGFSDENRTRQAPRLPNHAIWCLGHCALTMHRVVERLNGRGVPEEDFVRGDGTAGDARRFDTESVCFGSTPIDEPALYPTLARGGAIYERAADRLAEAVRAASDETLDRLVPWGRSELTARALIVRVCFHNGTHAGQITDLRRALGMPGAL